MAISNYTDEVNTGQSPLEGQRGKADLITTQRLSQERAEELLIGSIFMLDEDEIREAMRNRGLTPAMFSHEGHTRVMARFLDGEPIAGATMAEAKYLKHVGYVNQVASPRDWPHFIDRIIAGYYGRKAAVIAEAQVKAFASNDLNEVARCAQEIIRLTGLAEPKRAEKNRTSWTADELLAAEFTDPHFAVPGIIPEGLSILGARPKSGKSWLMLQASIAVAVGKPFMGIQVEQGPVLFVALEDNGRRLKNRIQKLNIPAGAPIKFETELKPLHRGGVFELLKWIEQRGDRMIVLDTVSRAFPGLDHTKDAALMGNIMGELQQAALQKGTALVCIDHTRKPNGQYNDPIDDIMGGSNKTGVADAVLAIYKEQGKAGAFLKGTGRDIENIDLTIQWDPMSCMWKNLGNTGGLILTEHRNEIIDALKANGKCSPKRVAELVGRDPSNVNRQLLELYAANLVEREEIESKFYYSV